MAHSRIDDLRRRVEADPASIAFAQLAEEYRRAGQTEEAVRVSREGLTRHPGYLSARVTLGRALLDLGQLNDARTELQFVATEAPENLAAVRGLAEIFHREGDAASALEYFQRALALARHDPELEEIVQQLSRQVGAESGPSNGLSFEEAHQELLSAADRVPLAPAAATADAAPEAAGDPQGTTAPFDFDTLVAALGTPAAPPLVEAVVRGETPEVFELPELPDAPGLPALTATVDPFAVLEAELRSHPVADAAEQPREAEAEPAEPAEAAPVEGWLTKTSLDDDGPLVEWTPTDDAAAPVAAPISAPDVADDPLLGLDASLAALLVPEAGLGDEPPAAPADVEIPDAADENPFALLEPPAVLPSDAPDDAETPPELAATTETVAVAVQETETVAVAVQEWSAPAEPDVATPSEALMAEVAPPASVDAPPADGTLDVPVTATSEPEPTTVAAALDEHPSAAADRRDDVLGDLEDWLTTLQDRSEP